jgi:hypothetical protein
MNAIDWLLLGAVTAFTALAAWACRAHERHEIERKFSARQKELRAVLTARQIEEHDAWIQTVGRGPTLVSKPHLTEEQIIERAKKRSN